MDIQFEKELLTRIDVLAAKIGTTAEYLWPLFVKRVFVDAVISLTLAVVVAVVCGAVALKLYRWARQKKMDERYGKEVFILEDVERGMCWFGLAFLIFVGVLVLCINVSISVPDLLVPEAKALFQLVK